MRRTWAGFGRLLRVAAGAMLLWLPAVVLGAWATFYLRSVYQTILAPGVPIVLPYEAVGGKYIFSAESYSFRPSDKEAHIVRAVLKDPCGHVIFKADRLDGKLDGEVYALTGNSLWLEVDRNRKDRFSVMDALPKPKEGPASKFRASLRDVTVAYLDSTAQPTLRTRVHSRAVVAEGDSDDFVASTVAEVNRSGSIDTRLQYAAKTGLTAHLKVNPGEYGGLFSHVGRWVDLGPKPPRLSTLNFAGPVQVVIPNKDSVRVTGSASGAVSGLSYQDYPSLSAPFQLTFDEKRAQGTLGVTTTDGLRADLKGAISWDKGLAAVANVKADAPNARALGRFAKDLRGAEFLGAHFVGRFGVNPKGQWLAEGAATAQEIRSTGQSIRAFSGDVLASIQGVSLRRGKGQWEGSPVEAALDTNFKSGALSGFARVAKLSASQLGVDALRGTGTALVTLSGSQTKPLLNLAAEGAFTWHTPKQDFALGSLDFRSSVQGSQLAIQRAVLSGKNGSYIVEGTVDLKAKTLALKLKGGGLDLENFSDQLEGLAFTEATITGTMSRPSVQGVVEGFGVGSGTRRIPVLSAKVNGTLDQVHISDIVAKSGRSTLSGDLTIAPKTGVLAGTLQGTAVQASDWIHPDVVGTFDFPQTRISGTITNPIAKFHVTGTKLAYANLRADSAVGDLEIKDSKLFFEKVVAHIGGGTLTLDGTHNLKESYINVNAEAKGIRLEELVPPTEGVSVAGSVSGKAQFGGRLGDELPLGQATLTMDELAVNKVRLGSGTAKLGHSGDRWVGKAEIGEDDRFIVADGLEWNQKSKAVKGTLDGLNLALGPIVEQVRTHLAPDQNKLSELLKEFKGNADFSASVEGTSDHPLAKLNQFEAKIAQFAGQKGGTVSVKGSYQDKVALVDVASWRLGDATALFRGGFNDKGFARDSDFEINNFDLQKLSPFVPQLASVNARATLSGIASGTFENPTATAGGRLTMKTGNRTGLGTTRAEQEYDADLLYNIEVANKKATVEGGYTAEGFSGTMQGQVPLSLLGIGQPNDDKLSLTTTIAERSLKDFKSLLPSLDVKRTDGSLGGALTLVQDSKGYGVTGELHLKGKSLALENVDQSLKDFSLSLAPQGNNLILKALAESSQGGKLVAQLNSDVSQLLQSAERVTTLEQALELCTVQGKVTTPGTTDAAPGVTVQVNPAKPNERIAARLNADVDVSGNLRNPILSGLFEAYGLDTPILAPPAGSGAYSLPFDPIFGDRDHPLRFGVGDIARIRTANGAVEIRGAGTLAGSLSSPIALANFSLAKGTFILPNARVELIPGGTLNLTYYASDPLPIFNTGQSRAQLIADIEGRTSASVRKTSDVYERYDIKLDITGNLLDNNLKVAYSSDPSDLTEDEIKGVLGQKELIEQLSAQLSRNGTSTYRPGITDTAYQFLLPTVAGKFTESLAQGLKLDSITLDYNSYEQASLTATKTLGTGLTLSMRRQLYNSPFVRNQYEVKLSYRIRSQARDLSRFRVSLGFNQSVPWRLTADYSIRF